MAIHEVDMTKAMTNRQYAIQLYRSGECNASELQQLSNRWPGIAEESKDGVQYEIEDGKKNEARAAGEKRAEEGAKGDDNEDFGGKADTAKSAILNVNAAGGAAGGLLSGIASVAGFLSKETSALIAAVSGSVLLTYAILLKALHPNEAQAKACDNMAPVLEDANCELEDLGEETSDVTNDLTDGTDELIKLDEDSAEEQKALEEQYQRLVARQQELLAKYEASKTGGEPFTAEDKAELDALNISLPVMFEQIGIVKATGDEQKAELTEGLEESQELYDSLGEKIEEVQGMTDAQAEYDEATVTNAGLTKATAMAGMAGSAGGVLAGILGWGKSIFHPDFWAAPVAVALNTASGFLFKSIMSEQADYKTRAEAGVENRHVTEDINASTAEDYAEDLDTYASNIEANDEIEFEETESVAPTIVTVGGTEDEEKDGNNNGNPFGNDTNPPVNSTQNSGVTIEPSGSTGNNPFAPKDKDDDEKKV